jgi:hypothetical protein
MIKVRGINYNAGIEYNPLFPVANKIDLTKLRKDLILIKKLNCNAIRFYGSYIDKLILYSQEALEKGFEVWISPRLINGDKKQTVKFVGEASKKAEELRKKYKKVVFIVGNELLIDSKVAFNSEKLSERIDLLGTYLNFKFTIKKEIPQLKPILSKIKKFIHKTDSSIKILVETLRKETSKSFNGKITYASFPCEEIEWKDFDIVGVNLYKSQWNELNYVNELKKFSLFGKPVAITEFGTCAYTGASKKGGSAYEVIDYSTKNVKEGIIRDEKEQARYLKELLELYNQENIYATFIFDFKEEWKTHSKKPKKDLDLSSFGIMKVLENGKVIPKKAFEVVRKIYSR